MAEVKIYTIPFCGFCRRAKRLLKKKKVEFTEANVRGDAEAMAEIRDIAGHSTFPQIVINGELIGGCDELYELDRCGRLDSLLASD